MNLNRLVAPILLAVVLMLLPSYIFEGQSQTAAHPAASTQCIDFDQDKTCEYIMLANGTMISNPLQAAQPATGTTSRTTQTTNFLPYENPTLGIRIQHPVGWQLEEDDNKVTFVQQKDIVSLETNVDNNIDSSLSDYVNTRLQELREQRKISTS
jgi:hypothetical protein